MRHIIAQKVRLPPPRLALPVSKVQRHSAGDDSATATTINAEHAEPAEKTGFVLRVLRFLR
jgi:hypothetical protein